MSWFSRSSRKAQPLGQPIHSPIIGRSEIIPGGAALYVSAIMRRCIGEIVNMVRDTTPQILDAAGKVRAEGMNNMPPVIQEPSAGTSMSDMISHAALSWHFHGDMCLLYRRHPNGLLRDMWIATKGEVNVIRSGGRIYYQSFMTDPDIVADGIVIRHSLISPGGIFGISQVKSGENLIQSSLKSDTSMHAFVDNQSLIGLVLKHAAPGEITKTQREALLTELAITYGGPENSGRPLLLPEGWEIDRLEPSMEESKLLEARRDLSAMVAQEIFFLDPRSLGYNLSDSGNSFNYANNTQLWSQNWKTAGNPFATEFTSMITDVLPGQFRLDATEQQLGGPNERIAYIEKMALANKHYAAAVKAAGIDDSGILFGADEIRNIGRFLPRAEKGIPSERPTGQPELEPGGQQPALDPPAG